jgi:shikimate kinase
MGKNKPIVVIGLMGSGKSTAGRLIADALGLPFSDSDTYLREHYGGPSAEIAARDGREVLHEREAEHVLRELSGEPKVIAAAASTVENAAVREAVRAAVVIWLDADDEVLTRRMSTSSHRPDYSPSSLRARREPLFREVADLTYDVAALKPEEVLAAALRDMDLLPPGED